MTEENNKIIKSWLPLHRHGGMCVHAHPCVCVCGRGAFYTVCPSEPSDILLTNTSKKGSECVVLFHFHCELDVWVEAV
jgi:hypothetical protein